MKKISHLIFISLLLFSLFGCSTNNLDKENQVEITVSAAASLNDALTEIKTVFEKENSTIKIVYNFGGSGSLQQQILQGAPVDIFISAAEDKFKNVLVQGIIAENLQKNLVSNDIVLIVPKNTTEITSFHDLTNQAVANISIGIPESVPAGKYAKETFKNKNLWHDIEKKLIYAKDVRQVLTYVASGNVDAGVVYRTDAKSNDEVKIVAVAEDYTHSPIVYPLGMIKNTEHPNETKKYFNYLQSKQAQSIFTKYGFKNLNN